MANTWLHASSYHPLTAPATDGRAPVHKPVERRWPSAEEIDAIARRVAAKQSERREQLRRADQ